MSMHSSLKKFISGIMSVMLLFFMMAPSAFAQSTVGTNLSTSGTLSVTGTSTLTGNVSAAGTLSVTGASTLTGNVSAAGALSVTGASTLTGNVTMTGDAAVNGGDITTSAATFNFVNAATTLNIGNTTVTRTINIGTGSNVDTINIGTDSSGADVIRIGQASADLALTDANWSITTAGLFTTASNAALNGGNITTTSAAFNLANEAATLNIGTTGVTRTIAIGTGTAVDTINIGTDNGTNADIIRIGAITAGVSSSDVAISDANWSITTAGVGSFDDVNVNGGDLIGNATMAVFNPSTSLSIGSTGVTRTIAIGTGGLVDTINIGTDTSGADVIRIGGSASGISSADVQIFDANWSITAAGVASFDDVSVNGGDIIGAATTNVFNAATALNIGTTSVTRTIAIGTGLNVDTINIGTDNSGADVIRIGAITSGVSSSDVAISDANWSITTAGVGSFDDVNVNGGDLIGNATMAVFNPSTSLSIGSTGVTRTIAIGTGGLVDTINIGTDNSGADVIRIGAITSGVSSSDVAISDANWSITTAGVGSFDDVNVNGGDITGAATMNVFNGSTTVNLGNTGVTRTIAIGTGGLVDTINIGTDTSGADVIRIGGSASGISSADVQIFDANWSITTAGVASFDDVSVNGGDIIGAATTNVFNAATALNIGSTGVTRTIAIGTGGLVDTINIGTDNSGADVIRIGAITSGVSSSDVAISDANWSITTAGVGSFDDVNVNGGDLIGNATMAVFNPSTSVSIGSTSVTRTIAIGTGGNVDTINIGTDNSGADVIRIGAITSGVSSSDVAISDAQWSITSPGVASFDDVNVGGGTILSALLHGTVAVTPSSVAIGGLCNVTSVAVTGIASGDKVFVTQGLPIANGFFLNGAMVPSAANALEFRYCSTSAAFTAPSLTTISWMAIR